MINKPDNRNGHELAPLNIRTMDTGVTIVVSPSNGAPRGSIVNRNSLSMGSPGEERAAWSGKLQFFLSIIGYSVGLGNIWRFPYLCQQNGGGAFLIPFVIMLVLEGIPLFLIEIGMGQRMRLGALGVWNTVHPWLGGIGIASCVVTFFVALYYNVIITWCFYYFFNSFQSPLPWSECPLDSNGTAVHECKVSSETAYFWYRTTLDVAPNMDDSGGLKWWIVLCLILSWVTVFFIVMKGIQSSGKVVYFTSMFPYVVLTIFFIRGITLKGSGAGLMHMYTPKVEKLADPTVWLDAATQVFYSFGLAFGSLIAFGSYNTPKNNCVRDVILVSFCNAATAIYASVVVFAILGFKAMLNFDRCMDDNKEALLAHKLIANNNVTDEQMLAVLKAQNWTVAGHRLPECSMESELDQAAEGTGLAFIVFTQAIVELPGAPFWSVIFFMMLLSLGIGSQIGILEGMLCTIFDIEIFKRIKKQYLTGFVCLICCTVGLLFCTGAGEYWLKLFDSFAGTIGLVLLALLEMVAVMFVYGHEKFTQDIEDMTGYRPGWYWQITWRFIGPCIMGCILVSSIVYRIVNNPTFSAWDAETGKTIPTEYPGWVMVIAVMMILAGILPMPLVFLLRRFQCLKFDVDIHQGSIRRIDTTVSTKEMMGDVDLDEYHDLPQDELDDDDDDDKPNNIQTLRNTRLNTRPAKNFKMEVMDF